MVLETTTLPAELHPFKKGNFSIPLTLNYVIIYFTISVT
jgi:hypothetical protein